MIGKSIVLPAAADVTDGATLTARAPLAVSCLTAGLALGLTQAGGVRPALALGLRATPGQGVPLLNHHGPPSAAQAAHHHIILHFDTRESVPITVTNFSPMVPVLLSVCPVAGLLVLLTVLVPVLPVAGGASTLRLYAGSVQAVVPAGQTRGRGQGPGPAGPGCQGVGRPVTPGHLSYSSGTWRSGSSSENIKRSEMVCNSVTGMK